VQPISEERLNRIWYGGEPAPVWLKGLVPVYRAASGLDRWWRTRRRPAGLAKACIIVVGNITVGGSGKTPLVVRLCRMLRTAGYSAGVISRGYGRKGDGLRLVSPASDPALVGDEPLLIAQQAAVPVIVCADRCAAAQALLKKGVQVIVSDDGLQHHRLPRSVEICVIDGTRGFGNGMLLPAGPLREPVSRLRTMDHVVVNGDFDGLPGSIEAVPMTLAAGWLRPLHGGPNWRLSQFAGCRVNAVAGIANPGRFFALLQHARIKPIEHPFPDHHAFALADFEGMDRNLPILMTEKDAVKCRKLALENAWFLSVDAVLPHEWENSLLQEVAACVQRQGSRR